MLKKIGLLILLITGLAPMIVNAQVARIRGTVWDENGDPINGASVTATTSGRSPVTTQTDSLGEFFFGQLVVGKKYDFTYSYIGYESFVEKNVPVTGNSATLFARLTRKAKELSDVVVTALGVERQSKSLGYSTQRVKGEEFESTRELNLANVLTGKVAGLQVNASTEMFISSDLRLRGVAPLLVVDGTPVNSTTWDLNFNDIETIDVLKGATAASLYGWRGINGAIVVTLKKGRANKRKVEFTSNNMIQPGLLTSPKLQTEYGSGGNGHYEYVDGSGAGVEGGGFTWGPPLDGRLIKQWNSPIDPATGERIPIPWVDRTGGKGNLVKFLRTGFITTNNINFEAGNEQGSYRISASYGHQVGIVPNTKMSTYGFNIGGKYIFSPKFQVNTSLNYSKQNSPNYRVPRYGSNDYIYSLGFWLGADIDLEDAKNYWEPGQEGVKQRFQQIGYYNNPYFLAYENINTYDKDVVYGQVSGDLTFIPRELTLKIRVGANTNTLTNSEHIPKGMVGAPLGNYTITNTRNFTIDNDAILTFNRRLSGVFSINAIAGASYYYTKSTVDYMQTNGLVTPLVYNMSNSLNPVTATNSFAESQTQSVYANVDLQVWKPFYVSLTGRNDWVSTLPVGNNSYFYPSASLSIVLSDWLKLPQVINFLKIRSSIAQVNTGTTGSTYGHIQTYPVGVYNNMPTMTVSRSLIPGGLQPAASRTYEFGGNIAFFGNRLNIDVTYYNRLDYDNIISQPVSIATGYNSVTANGREYETKGFEATLNSVPVRTASLQWNLTFNVFSWHKYLKALENGLTQDGYIKLGSRVDQIYAIPLLRNPDGELIINAGTGLPQVDPYRRYTGNYDPDFMFGIQNTIRYKNISLSFTFDGRKGGEYFSILPRMVRAGTSPEYDAQARADAANGLINYVGKGVVVASGSVQYDGLGNIISDTRRYAPNTKPVSYEGWAKSLANIAGGRSESFLAADYLKLRDVSLGWNIPRKLLGNTKISTAEVSIFGNNLLLFTKKGSLGDDPSWLMGLGTENANLKSPVARSYGVQFKLTF